MGWISSLDIIASGRDPRSSVLDRLTDALSLTLYDRAATGLSSGPVEDYGPETFADHRMTDMVVEIVRGHWGIGSRMLADLYRPKLSDEAVLHLARVFRDSAPAEVSAAYLEATYPQDVSKLLPEISAPGCLACA